MLNKLLKCFKGQNTKASNQLQMDVKKMEATGIRIKKQSNVALLQTDYLC